MSQRDLSLALDRALRTQSTVVLQRGEARALLALVEEHSADAEIGALALAIRTALIPGSGSRTPAPASRLVLASIRSAAV